MRIWMAEELKGDTLVVVFLRGAADGLNIVVPFGEDAYYTLRPTLAIPRPDDLQAPATERVVDLDGFFGLHPSLKDLLPAWQAGHLAFIHACGAPDESRSHFKAMELMERGVEDETGPASGWIGRHLATLNNGNPSPLRAIGLGERVPRSLYGAVPATALRSIADFHLGGDLQAANRMQAALAAMYAGEEPLSQVGQETLHILQALRKVDETQYRTSGAYEYPETEFGRGLKQIAMLIKAQVGLEVAAIDLGGWDTHFAQGSSDGLMPGLLADLGQGLAAFHDDMNARLRNLTLVVMSEFGRRAKENASLGTDHGHGSLMMVLGGNVRGQRVYTQWPGLLPDQLFGPGDLAVTIDYRDVLAEILWQRLNNPSLNQIFPGFKYQIHGFFRGEASQDDSMPLKSPSLLSRDAYEIESLWREER